MTFLSLFYSLDLVVNRQNMHNFVEVIHPLDQHGHLQRIQPTNVLSLRFLLIQPIDISKLLTWSIDNLIKVDD